MAKLVRLPLIALLFLSTIVVGALGVWPEPENSSAGYTVLPLSKNFRFSAVGDALGHGTLDSAFDRYYDIIFMHHTLYMEPQRSTNDSTFLETLIVQLQSMDETLQLGVDESYTLQIPHPTNSSAGILKAATVYGALRGLETFSQLCAFNYQSRTIQVSETPLYISDRPRFEYRGLLIDTSRHYEPVQIIKTVIDSMAYAKLNVLHWHIVDEQSFPIETPSFPKLWDGAYTGMERFTVGDAKAIVEYGRQRGVNVMAELDVPGHARSWGVGYPDLWPAPNCTEPLDLTNEFTFELIEGIISDFAKVFPFKFIHLGGDEVDTSCWRETRHVRRW